ncbi:MAG: polysaccharide deacetylase family protein [Bacilli bacterium]
MKKLFQTIGIISLITISFFYTEKTVEVVKEYDDILIEIKSKGVTLNIDNLDAIIENNTIIPGLNGRKIDINKSYSKMKQFGKYNDNLIVYTTTIPKISLSSNLDKYIISGNSKKNMISLIFLVDFNDSINNIITSLKEKNVKGNFFIDGNWLENNKSILNQLNKNGHLIGNLSYNRDYLNSGFIWMDTIIKRVNKNNHYCFNQSDNDFALKLCAINKNYTIRPILISTFPTINMKKKLSSGGLIAFEITKELENELPIIIDYIISKGYVITTLNEHLSE